jgi:hypothetical protein
MQSTELCTVPSHESLSAYDSAGQSHETASLHPDDNLVGSLHERVHVLSCSY